MNSYTLELQNDKIHNIIPLVGFLSSNQDNDIEIEVNQESHCLRFCGIYDLLDKFNFSSVTIYTANAVEYHDKYIIKSLYNWYHWLGRTSKFDHGMDYTWNGNKIFGCFYGRPTVDRLGIASYLANNHRDESLLSLKFDISNEDTRKQFEVQKLFSWDPACLDDLAHLICNLKHYASKNHAYDYTTSKYDFGNQLNHLYKDIFIDLVSEATLAGNSFLPSEKIARAILCKKPFIVMAPTYYLKYLRQMGFRTFNTIWDESYDDLGGKNRYFAVLKLIDWVATQPLNKLQTQIAHIVDHNYQLLLYNRRFTTKIKRYE